MAATLGETARDLVHARMAGAYPLSVGLEVAIGAGPDWNAAAH